MDSPRLKKYQKRLETIILLCLFYFTIPSVGNPLGYIFKFTAWLFLIYMLMFYIRLGLTHIRYYIESRRYHWLRMGYESKGNLNREVFSDNIAKDIGLWFFRTWINKRKVKYFLINFTMRNVLGVIFVLIFLGLIIYLYLLF